MNLAPRPSAVCCARPRTTPGDAQSFGDARILKVDGRHTISRRKNCADVIVFANRTMIRIGPGPRFVNLVIDVSRTGPQPRAVQETTDDQRRWEPRAFQAEDRRQLLRLPDRRAAPF